MLTRKESSPGRIAAILPCYKSRDSVLALIAAIEPYVDLIICVDDACPQKTGDLIAQSCSDPRVTICRHDKNQGVGGAVCTGYRKALELGADICVKIDSDGQMDPSEMDVLLEPIAEGFADYTKGNRFFNLEDVQAMPKLRLIGNAGLSFLTKLSSGYWNIFDPTNGYTAIHARVLERLPFDKLAKRYFFESDLLFRLGTMKARVLDIPMRAHYGDEKSNMEVHAIALPFLFNNLRNFLKRLFYSYFLRDFSAASLYVLLALSLTSSGVAMGIHFYMLSNYQGIVATSGNVMLVSLSIILGAQFGIAFLHYDAESTPTIPIHPLLRPLAKRAAPVAVEANAPRLPASAEIEQLTARPAPATERTG